MYTQLRVGGVREALLEKRCGGAFFFLSNVCHTSTAVCEPHTHMQAHAESMPGQLPCNHHHSVCKRESVGRGTGQHGGVEEN